MARWLVISLIALVMLSGCSLRDITGDIGDAPKTITLPVEPTATPEPTPTPTPTTVAAECGIWHPLVCLFGEDPAPTPTQTPKPAAEVIASPEAAQPAAPAVVASPVAQTTVLPVVATPPTAAPPAAASPAPATVRVLSPADLNYDQIVGLVQQLAPSLTQPQLKQAADAVRDRITAQTTWEDFFKVTLAEIARVQTPAAPTPKSSPTVGVVIQPATPTQTPTMAPPPTPPVVTLPNDHDNRCPGSAFDMAGLVARGQGKWTYYGPISSRPHEMWVGVFTSPTDIIYPGWGILNTLTQKGLREDQGGLNWVAFHCQQTP